MKKKKSRRRKTRRRVVVAFLLISIIFISGINICKYFNVPNAMEIDTSNLEKEIEESKPVEYFISLVMVGDALIHDKIYNEAKKIGNGTYDFTPMLKEIKPIVQGYDLAYYNQETILGGSEIGVSSYPAFNSPYEVGNAMIDAGFNLVSLATNHTLDRGKKAIINSRKYWDSKEEILAVGSYTSFEERNNISILEKNNITYTMLNYTYGTNGISVPRGEEYLVNLWPVVGTSVDKDINYQNYKENVKKDIELVRNKVDLLMVAMHWGVEYQMMPNDYQKDMARFLESLGVDIIIGTHPHVIQPVTFINDTLVIYSLGNFISAHEVINMANRIGLMSSVTIVKKEVDGKMEIQLTNLENELLYTSYTKDYQNILVIPFSNMSEEILPDYKTIYNEYKDVVQALNKDILVKSIT